MELKRRNFIRVALGVAAQVAMPTFLLADVGDAEEKYYEAFRQRCRRLTEQDYEIKACWLAPPHDGLYVSGKLAKGIVGETRLRILSNT